MLSKKSAAKELLRRRHLMDRVVMSEILERSVRQAIAEHRRGWQSDEECFGMLMQYAELAMQMEKKKA